MTPVLEAEGHARDLIRDIQQARRSAGLDVSDRIELRFEGDEDLAAVLEAFGDLVRAETLTVSSTSPWPARARPTASRTGRTGTSRCSPPAAGVRRKAGASSCAAQDGW
ncbi:hypothetical protein GCM10025866_24700 [Naasia aerilata]|uniref:Uncharacterized protein n=1 Tax=Naasia aerilata TaxID=1162966 RepID=A0ABM8GE38_9MICO|nr:hypothetical protein GCM10025866_24700 [Naasia aerilata]